MCEEIGRCDHQIRYIITNGIHIGEMASSIHPELREEWIPRIAKGEMMSLAFTEPRGGADAGNITTKAVKDGDHWIISGEKTASPSRRVEGRLATADRPPGPGASRSSDPDHPRCQAVPFERMGQRLDRGGSFFFDEADPGATWSARKTTASSGDEIIGHNRCFVPLACIGAARNRSRRRPNTPRASDHGRRCPQAVATELANAATQLDAARMLCYRALWLKDQGQRHDTESSMAKWFGVKVANEVLYTCMRLHGHYGYAKEFPFEQRVRDCIGMESADGPREIHHGIIARDLLGKEFAPF